jgi:hypothetical protein
MAQDRDPVFELVPVTDESGEGWLIIRTRPERRIVRRVKDHATANLVMQAMEALARQPPGGPYAE